MADQNRGTDRWKIVISDYWAASLKRFLKKHPNETKAMLSNLGTYQKAIFEEGLDPYAFNAGFIHREPMGIRAIDQKGTIGKAKQTRLYVYAWIRGKELHLIKIGDKTQQSRDINNCKKYVTPLKEEDKKSELGE